jgi:GAF domain-containing protein
MNTHRQFAEQIAAALEQALLHEVLHTAGSKRRAIRLLRLRQFLAQPAHCAVQMMQRQLLGGLDPIVLAPGVGGPIGA